MEPQHEQEHTESRNENRIGLEAPVLIVDDMPGALFATETLVKSLDVPTVTAQTGDEALGSRSWKHSLPW